jgi:hypothetical protein
MMAGVTFTRISLACFLFGVAPQVDTPAQSVASRVTASVDAIVAGDSNDARREAIVARLRNIGVEPAVEPFGGGNRAGANVVVTLSGSTARTIVIGAHLDRVSVGRGAVDNGAGCAALIELVAAVTTSPLKRSTLHVVFFDREEAGLLGSRAFVADRARRPDFAVNVDIFAYGDTVFATASHSDGILVRSLRATEASTGLPVRAVPRNNYPSSDHQTLMNAGIETLGLALLDQADVEGVLAVGAGRLKPGTGPRILTIIHTPNDTIAEVRPEQMARGIAFVEQLIRTVDVAF